MSGLQLAASVLWQEIRREIASLLLYHRVGSGRDRPRMVSQAGGYWTTPSFRRSDSRIEGPLPRHLPEVASRNPRQCSKGNGDSGRLVPRTRAGEQALQRDTPLNTESFARKGRSCSPSCSRTLPCACACARVRWIQAVAGMGEAWASVTYRQSRRECPHVLSGALGVASRDDIQWSESAVNVVFLPVNVV